MKILMTNFLLEQGIYTLTDLLLLMRGLRATSTIGLSFRKYSSQWSIKLF